MNAKTNVAGLTCFGESVEDDPLQQQGTNGNRLVEAGVEVPYIADLAGDGDTLLVLGPHGSVEVEGLVRLTPLTGEQQPGTDHQARPALTGLAVHHGDVVLALVQPGLHVVAELLDQRERRRVVVVKRVLGHCGALSNNEEKE